jgi:hypothetical protein
MTGHDLSPRRMTFTIAGGSNDGTIRPLDFAHPILAAELSDALVDMRRTFALADGTAYQYRVAVISLLRSLTNACPRTASLAWADRVVVDGIHEWESGLAAAYPAESTMPYKYGRQLRRLVRVHIANGRDVGLDVERWADGQVLHQGGGATPLDEFSNAERLAIRDTCRSRIRELEERLSIGHQLLEVGRDPRGDGWSRAEDILWGIHHLGRTDGIMVEREAMLACDRGVLNDLHEAFETEHATTYGGSGRVVRRLLSYLYPSSDDLVAFRTLLQLETGAAPEEWSNVSLSDIDISDPDTLRVRLYKARAHRSRIVRCATSGSASGSGWKSGDLIERVLAATSRARELREASPSPVHDALFLSVFRTSSRRLEVRPDSFSNSFSSLLTSITPAISRPHDARRLRKTVKSVRAAVLRSADIAAGDDHSIAVYQRHYAQTTTVHVLAGAAVNAAQQQVFDRVSGPVFVKASAASIRAGERPELAVAAVAELESTSTDRAMNVAHCSSPYDSPYGRSGRLCEHRPSMCFACPNAIVFTDHLPRILAYREILRGHQNEMEPAQFAATHGQQLRNIERILDEFTPAERERAQRSHDLDAVVHVPIAQRGVHL